MIDAHVTYGNVFGTRTLPMSLLSLLLCTPPKRTDGEAAWKYSNQRKPRQSRNNWRYSRMTKVAGDTQELTRVIDEDVQRAVCLAKELHESTDAFDAREIKRQRLYRRSGHLSADFVAGGRRLRNNGPVIHDDGARLKDSRGRRVLVRRLS